MIKTILAIVEGPVRGSSFIDAVLGLADQRQAHMIFDVLTAAPMLSPNLAPFGTVYTLSSELRQLVRDHASSLRAFLPPNSQAEIVSQCDDVGWIPGDVRASAPLADLVMIGPHESWSIDWLRRRTIETVLMASGTPLLLLPPGRSIRNVGHAVLGWKPGPTAMRALQNLVRLAAPGARIDVVAIKHGLADQPETALEPVLALLHRHGFGVEGHALERSGKAQDRLTSFALDRGADLLVVGGFAHSRMREIVLGGVTRSLIDDPRLPVLMAH
jgi:nucleotide-binding universal stress UspA family protein